MTRALTLPHPSRCLQPALAGVGRPPGGDWEYVLWRAELLRRIDVDYPDLDG